MTVTIKVRRERQPPGPGLRNAGGDIKIEGSRRWVRLAAYWGEPPGSHIGLWHTDTGTVHGWNLRIGRRYIGPCLTLFVHTRRVATRDRP